MSEPAEFHYRLPHLVGGWRPGSHPGTSLGAGQEFVSHMRLYDRPDPRRLDLRASLSNLYGDWLVRVNRQRAAVQVYAVVDVSPSMQFGSQQTKLQIAADFVDALGRSTFRVADALGMLAFDTRERTDLFVPPVFSRGMGSVMASLIRQSQGNAGDSIGIEETVLQLAGRHVLVFLVSDFHWPLDRLVHALDSLTHAHVVPIIIWDVAETHPPMTNALAPLMDVESKAQRTLWVRPRLRTQWVDAVAKRRADLAKVFAARAIRPFYVEGEFDCEAMSRYFFEATT